jgi:hypothetical protein
MASSWMLGLSLQKLNRIHTKPSTNSTSPTQSKQKNKAVFHIAGQDVFPPALSSFSTFKFFPTVNKNIVMLLPLFRGSQKNFIKECLFND